MCGRSDTSKRGITKADGSTACVFFTALLFSAGASMHAAPPRSAAVQSEAGAASGVGPRQKAVTAQDLVDRLNAALALSDAQKTAFLPMIQKLQDELSSLKASGATRGTDASQVFTLTAMAQVRSQLTETQQQAFDGMRADRRRELFTF